MNSDAGSKSALGEELGLVPTAYDAGGGAEIVACKQMDGSRLWAVRLDGYVLNKHDGWEREPMPSNRDEAFLRRCRFATLLEARDAYMASLRA